jgi:hypothetical protein
MLLSAASQAAEQVLPVSYRLARTWSWILAARPRRFAACEACAGDAKLMSADYLKGSPWRTDPLKDIDDVIIAVAGEGEEGADVDRCARPVRPGKVGAGADVTTT